MVIRSVAGIAAWITLLPFLHLLASVWGEPPSFLKTAVEVLVLLAGMLLGVLVIVWAGAAYAHKQWMQVRRAGWRAAVATSIFLIATGITPLARYFLGDILSLFIDVPDCDAPGRATWICQMKGYSRWELIEWDLVILQCVFWIVSWVPGLWLLSCSLSADVRFIFSKGYRPAFPPEPSSHVGPYPDDGALANRKR